MKITKIYVSSFGKLKNYELNANDGIVSVNEENGWGKSTLATFIKCMFYGIDDGKRDVEKNERKHYRPWMETGLFGGYIEFCWGDGKYRIERYFGTKSSEDTVKIIDLKTGLPSSKTDNLGERIFDIDEEGFLSTAYYSQSDAEIKNNSSLAAKYNDDFSAEDSQAFDSAVVNLEDKIRRYKLRGDKGLIADTKRELYYAEEEVARLKTTDAMISPLKEKIAELEETVIKEKERLKELNDKIAAAGKEETVRFKIDRLKETEREAEELIAKKEELEKFFNGYYPTEKELDGYAEKYRKTLEFAAAEKATAQIIEGYESAGTSRKKPSFLPLLLILAALFMGASVACFGLNLIVLGIVFICCCIGCGIGSAVVIKKSAGKNADAQKLSLYRTRLEDISAEKKGLEDKISAFLGRFNLGETDVLSAISLIKSKLGELQQLTEQVAAKKSLCEKYAEDEDVKGGEVAQKTDSNLLKIEFEKEKDVYAEDAQLLADMKAKLIRYEENAETQSDAELKVAELKERLKEYSHDYGVFLKTLELLKSADEKLKSTYRAPLENALNKYLAYIDGGKLTAKIDLSLKVSIEEKGVLNESAYYSMGYKNLFDICKRFALIDVIFKKEKPFVVLDDPFYNLDDDKVEKAKELLKKLAEEYQIIYFVCHRSRDFV